MDDSFELLEEKVRKAAELVTRLRGEKRSLEQEVSASRARLQDAERRADSLEKQRGAAADGARGLERAEQELKALRQEREEVRQRIAKLLEVLDSLEQPRGDL